MGVLPPSPTWQPSPSEGNVLVWVELKLGDDVRDTPTQFRNHFSPLGLAPEVCVYALVVLGGVVEMGRVMLGLGMVI